MHKTLSVPTSLYINTLLKFQTYTWLFCLCCSFILPVLLRTQSNLLLCNKGSGYRGCRCVLRFVLRVLSYWCLVCYQVIRFPFVLLLSVLSKLAFYFFHLHQLYIFSLNNGKYIVLITDITDDWNILHFMQILSSSFYKKHANSKM